ncbi:STAS domain-containing protein [Skermania sp. ID1734]|uniref:STAS domain-containing protein n=1 Tax=Skermania sp. ID1734 TaxID=2597516 RepID=UPI00117C297F|nr:STAS domain-containing protein [Skermania sp. ID1734]TSE01491.1 STAS domain-containing protein [Skermania sp. ID1734]
MNDKEPWEMSVAELRGEQQALRALRSRTYAERVRLILIQDELADRVASTHLSTRRPMPPIQHLSVQVRRVDGVPVIAFAGEIDLATAPELDPPLRAELLKTWGPGIVVDLDQVHFLSSAGVAHLIDAGIWAADMAKSVVISVSAQVVAKVLRLANFDSAVSVCASVAEAVAKLRADTAAHRGEGRIDHTQ